MQYSDFLLSFETVKPVTSYIPSYWSEQKKTGVIYQWRDKMNRFSQILMHVLQIEI